MELEELFTKVGNELEALRKDLDFEVEDMTLKQAKRAVKNLRSMLIATLEHPLDRTQELGDDLQPLFDRCFTIRQYQTAITMHSVAETQEEINE